MENRLHLLGLLNKHNAIKIEQWVDGVTASRKIRDDGQWWKHDDYMMDNFETELVVMGAKIALKTYKLPIEPSQLKNFDTFHKKYGKYIVEAGN